MLKRIFISFREIDRQNREAFEGILKNPNSPLKGTPISSRKDVRNQGEKSVKNYIKGLIDESDCIIVLIGNDSHNSTWIDYEMEVATSKKKPILGVRIPSTSGAGPELFRQRLFIPIEWDVNIIKENLDRIKI